MLYAATAFWLMVIVLTAWGVYALWSGMVKPRVVNIILLPGTLVAQMGHVLGLLITGATVSNTALFKDDETAAPVQTEDAKPRIPVLGPVIIGMLPIITCAVAIFAAAHLLRGATVTEMTSGKVNQVLPRDLPAFWDMLRHQIDLMEGMLAAAMNNRLRDWHTWLFIYLVICLTVRMAPFPGNARGSLGAILVLGALTALAGTIFEPTRQAVESGWPILSLSVTTLLLLLLITLLVRGLISLARVLSEKA